MAEISLKFLQKIFPSWEIEYINSGYVHDFYRFIGNKCNFFIAKSDIDVKIIEQIKDIYKSFDYIIQFLSENDFIIVENDETMFISNTYYHKNNISVFIYDGLYYIQLQINGELTISMYNSDEFISKMREILNVESQNKPIVQ